MARWFNVRAILIFIVGFRGVVAYAQTAPSFNDLVEQATAAREQNDVPGAIELYSKAVQANPRWSQGWWFLGALQYQAGAFAAARDSLTRFIAIAPNPAPAFGLRGLSELETAEYPQALTDIRESISLGEAEGPPNGERLRFSECLLLTRLGKFNEALRAYQPLVPWGGANPELVVGLGLAGLRMALLPKDASDSQLQIAYATGDATYAFMSQGETAGAKAFANLFQKFPTAPNLHGLYGTLLFASDPDLAFLEFKRELEIAPSNPRSQVLMAWALLMQDRASDALPYARKAVEEMPVSAGAQLVLGRSLVKLGDLKEGTNHLEQALQTDPENLEVHIALAEAYSRSGRSEDAQRERSMSLKLSQNGTSPFALP
jgi:tetratricopeptide (TPR) repeat protein